MTAAQSTQAKLLAVLAGATNEGEAMSAWRKLRRGKPEGWLFEPTGAVEQQNAAYRRGWSDGYFKGMSVGEGLSKDLDDLRKRVAPEKRPMLPEWLRLMVMFIGWYGLISMISDLVLEVLK